MRRPARVVFLCLFACPAVALADPSALVLPVEGPGVDPVVVQLLTNALRDRVRGRGYAVAAGGPTAPVAADAAALRAAASAAGATIGVSARVSIPAVGRYRLTITTVSTSSEQSWTGDEEITGADVLALLDRLVVSSVPVYIGGGAAEGLPPIVSSGPPAAPDAQGLPPIVSNAPGPPGGEPPIVDPGTGELSVPDARLIDDEEPDTLQLRRVRVRQLPRWMIGAVNEAVVGTNRGFFNYLAGLRVQLAFSQQFFGFGTVEYAYYSDDPGFGLVVHGGIEGRVRLGRTGNTGLPFRFSLGYAPENGGVLKLDMGFSIAIGKSTDLVLVPLAPTVWFLDGGNAVSMDFAVEINTGI